MFSRSNNTGSINRGLNKALVCGASFVVAMAISQFANAHAEGPSMDDFGLDASLDVLRRAVEISPLVVAEEDKPEIAATMEIGGRKVYLNSYFYDLVKRNIRLYYEELERDLPGCQSVPLGQVMTEVDEMAGQGFLKNKVLDPLGTAASHIGISAADIGGQLGDAALVAKAAAEVGEGVLSKVVGGGGVHVFCSVIDAVIVFQTRGLQSAYRSYAYADGLDTTMHRNVLYWAAVAWSVSRVQNRVAFEFEPFEVDEHEMEEVDEEGPRRFWGLLDKKPKRWWGFVEDGRRARWVAKIAKNAATKKENLGNNDLSKIAQIGHKNFNGKRYKRYFWLMARRWGKSKNLAGDKVMDESTKGNVLWILSAQENVLHRSLVKSEDGLESGVKLLTKLQEGLPQYPADEVRDSLSEEYGNGDPVLAEEMNKLFLDIERVFDPKVDKSMRYMQTLMIESFLTGFVYKHLNAQLPAMYTREGMWGYRMWKAFQTHWYASRYAHYAHKFTDFLRVASVQDKPEVLLSHKYEAMEVLMRIFRHLNVVVPKSGQAPADWLAEVSVANKKLKAMHPWSEKRSKYSFLPLIPWRENFSKLSFLPDAEDLWWIVPRLPSRAPLCVDMDKQRRVL